MGLIGPICPIRKPLRCDMAAFGINAGGLLTQIRCIIVLTRYPQQGNGGWQMKKHIWARLALLLVTVSTLSGCIWWPDDGGGRGHGDREREGEHHEEHRGGDEGGRR
jgi:hypothetical protein